LTFDELPTPQVIPGLNYGIIPNGYGGFLWNNFDVLDAAIRPPTEDYNIGMVSPNNVAFNPFGAPSSITVSSGSFDLDSAYLTCSVYQYPLDLQVEGFHGTTLLYNNTYMLNVSPTLVNLNYLGVDRVSFTPPPDKILVMDNLMVTVPEPSAIRLLMIGVACAGLSRRMKRY
jgi:hypothetical protein